MKDTHLTSGDIVAEADTHPLGRPEPRLILDAGTWRVRRRRRSTDLVPDPDGGPLALILQDREISDPDREIELLRRAAVGFDLTVLGSAAAPPVSRYYSTADGVHRDRQGWRLPGAGSPLVHVAPPGGLVDYFQQRRAYDHDRAESRRESAIRREVRHQGEVCATELKEVLGLDRSIRVNHDGVLSLEAEQLHALFASLGMTVPPLPEPEPVGDVSPPAHRLVTEAEVGDVVTVGADHGTRCAALILGTELMVVQQRRFGRQRLLPARLVPAAPGSASAGIPALMQEPEEDEDLYLAGRPGAADRLRNLAADLDLDAFDKTWERVGRERGWRTPLGHRTRLILLAPESVRASWADHLTWSAQLAARNAVRYRHKVALREWTAALLPALADELEGVPAPESARWQHGVTLIDPATAAAILDRIRSHKSGGAR